MIQATTKIIKLARLNIYLKKKLKTDYVVEFWNLGVGLALIAV